MSLHEAIASNDVEAVKTALASGTGRAELNVANDKGDLPLHEAIKAKNYAIATVLLEAGANVNQAHEDRGTTRGYTAAHFAARVGDVDALEVLAKFNADFNRRAADEWAPLHTACFAGKSQAMRFLVERGADVNIHNEHGMTPLVFVSNHGRAADVRFLIGKGASVDFVDAQGDSLMHHALHFRLQEMFEGSYDMPECQYDVVIALAIHGAPVARKNLQGNLPTKWTTECDIPALADVLAILHANAESIRKVPGGKDINFMSLVASDPSVFVALGLPPTHAHDLQKAVGECNTQRIAEKKEREESRPAGGCPVMKGGRKKKQKDGGAAEEKTAAAAGHPPMDLASVPEGTDPSGGQCPFFAKKAKQAAISGEQQPPPAKSTTPTPPPPTKAKTTTPATNPVVKAAATVEPAAGRDTMPALNWDYLWANRTTILLMVFAFFMGSYMENKFGAKAATLGPLHRHQDFAL